MRLMKKQMREEQGSDFISDSAEFVEKTLMNRAEVIQLSLPCPVPQTDMWCVNTRARTRMWHTWLSSYSGVSGYPGTDVVMLAARRRNTKKRCSGKIGFSTRRKRGERRSRGTMTRTDKRGDALPRLPVMSIKGLPVKGIERLPVVIIETHCRKHRHSLPRLIRKALPTSVPRLCRYVGGLHIDKCKFYSKLWCA